MILPFDKLRYLWCVLRGYHRTDYLRLICEDCKLTHEAWYYRYHEDVGFR